VQLVDRADLPRFAQLGVIANFEPLWAQLDAAQTEQTLPLIGDERGRLQYPMGDLLTRGGVLSMGSDWPVSSYRPLEGLAVAVTRQTEDGEPAGGWLPEQRLPAAAALSAYTLGTAYQAFEDHLWGTVSPGKRADLVWLSRDPYAVPAPEWPAIEVRGTWLGGVRTF
jgi:predicted amidohydrolase YtcJ